MFQHRLALFRHVGTICETTGYTTRRDISSNGFMASSLSDPPIQATSWGGQPKDQSMKRVKHNVQIFVNSEHGRKTVEKEFCSRDTGNKWVDYEAFLTKPSRKLWVDKNVAFGSKSESDYTLVEYRWSFSSPQAPPCIFVQKCEIDHRSF